MKNTFPIATAAPKVDTAKVDQKMKVMQDMHAKMMDRQAMQASAK